MAPWVVSDLLRICCDPVSLPMVRAAILLVKCFARWMVLPCPLHLFPLALPQFSPSAYTLAYPWASV